MDDFNDAARHSGIIEIDPKGAFFTWDIRQVGDNNTKSRIDRIFVNHEWLDIFNQASIEGIPTIFSDHHMMKIFLAGKEKIFEAPFRFINAWIK